MSRDAVRSFADVAGPLNGVLVLELCGDEPSGTLGTQILADLGATVIKIERPPAGEPPATRLPEGPVPRNIAYTFGLNRNKRSVCLDFKSDDGKAAFRDLVRAADVLYENYKPGTLARLGLDPATLRAAHPALICCSVSGFGQTGPWSGLPAYDATIQALGGGMSITGADRPDGPPVRWGNPIGGIGGALFGVIGVLAALHRRRRTENGATLDVALLDAQLAMQAYRVPPALSGAPYSAMPRRGGSGALPYGPFRTADGRWFVLGITAQFWARAAALLGHPEWTDDPRFRTEADRQANEAALNEAVGAAMRAHDAGEWQRRFVAAGIPGAKVNTLAEAFAHPHVALRDMLVSFDQPVGSRMKVAGNPIKLSQFPFAGFAPVPGLGADTRAVLEGIAGRSAADVEALRTRGAAWWPRDGEVFERPSVV